MNAAQFEGDPVHELQLEDLARGRRIARLVTRLDGLEALAKHLKDGANGLHIATLPTHHDIPAVPFPVIEAERLVAALRDATHGELQALL